MEGRESKVFRLSGNGVEGEEGCPSTLRELCFFFVAPENIDFVFQTEKNKLRAHLFFFIPTRSLQFLVMGRLNIEPNLPCLGKKDDEHNFHNIPKKK